MHIEDFKFERRVPGGNGHTTINTFVNKDGERIIEKISKIDSKFGNERYIIPEIAKKVDNIDEFLRRFRNDYFQYLEKEFGLGREAGEEMRGEIKEKFH